MSEPSDTGMHGWRLSLMLAGSAALGGIAVAIWNRRFLAQLREAGTRPAAVPPPSLDADNE